MDFALCGALLVDEYHKWDQSLQFVYIQCIFKEAINEQVVQWVGSSFRAKWKP